MTPPAGRGAASPALAAVGTPARCEGCATGYVVVAVAVDATPDELDVTCPGCGSPVYVIDAELLGVEALALTSRTDQVDVADDDVPRCRVCGCTDNQACPGGCWWVPDPEMLGELCSACLPVAEPDRPGPDPGEIDGGGVDDDLAVLLEECADCTASGGECAYHQIFAAGWDACAAFMARWVGRAGALSDVAGHPELAGRGGGG